MTNIQNDRSTRITLLSGEYHIHLTIRLGHDFVGGDIVRFPPVSVVSLEGVDESSSYTRTNWTSGLSSGALYAFRTLKIPRRCVEVVELIGRLRANDMESLANAAALAVAKLSGKELSIGLTEGWTIQENETQLT